MKLSSNGGVDLPAHQRPADLAALIHSYLSSGVGMAGHDRDSIPSIESLTQVFDVLFYLSLQAEEGQPIACSAAFMASVNRPKISRPNPLQIDFSASKCVRFPRPIPWEIKALRKLASAVDPSCAAIAVESRGSRLFISGVVDQFPLHLDRFNNWESTKQEFVPGLFCTRITGVGELTVYIRDRVVATLRQNKLIRRELDAIWKGPLSTALQRHVQRFQRKIKSQVGTWLYNGAGRWFEATDELWRCSEDFGDELRNEWLGALSRVLLKIRAYRHGGALIICPKAPTDDLNIKHEFVYTRIPDSLEAYAAAHISQLCIETEARQGRLHRLEFQGKPIAQFGYFVTPDARENIFMQGIALPEHDVLFRSWNYLALRADARAALAGAVGLVASLSKIDGAVLFQKGLDVAGFGVEIRTKRDVDRVYLAEDEDATRLTLTDPRAYGTRHRSMMRYCQAHPSAVGLVVSQDGDIRAFTTVASKLVMWEHLQLKAGTLDEYIFGRCLVPNQHKS